MKSLLLRNTFFTIVQPGIVAVLVPYLLSGGLNGLFNPAEWNHVVGAIAYLTGFVILITCIYQLANEGKGTLSPADPTKQLVTGGPYRYSRNPMYIGVILMLVGVAVAVPTRIMWLYALLVFIAFNLFIIYVEEPRLRRDFGEAYKSYCENVRRWL